MAMTKCTECSEPISGAAKTCPHCGAPHDDGRMGGFAKGLLWVVGVIVAGIAIFVIAGVTAGKHDESVREATVQSDLASVGLTMTSYNVFEYNQSPTGMYYICGNAGWTDTAGKTGTTSFAIEEQGQGGTITAHSIDSTNGALARKYDAIRTVGCNWQH